MWNFSKRFSNDREIEGGRNQAGFKLMRFELRCLKVSLAIYIYIRTSVVGLKTCARVRKWRKGEWQYSVWGKEVGENLIVSTSAWKVEGRSKTEFVCVCVCMKHTHSCCFFSQETFEVDDTENCKGKKRKKGNVARTHNSQFELIFKWEANFLSLDS